MKFLPMDCASPVHADHTTDIAAQEASHTDRQGMLTCGGLTCGSGMG